MLFDQVSSLTDDFDIALRFLRKPLDSALSLLVENSKLGASVEGTQRIRRLLLGPQLRYGLFYVEENRRIMIHALLDMRQDPQAIQSRIRSI